MTLQELRAEAIERYSLDARTNRDGTQVAPASVRNYLSIIQQDPALKAICYNTRASNYWIKGSVPWNKSAKSRELTNEDLNNLTHYLGRYIDGDKRDMIMTALDIAAHSKDFDPVKDALQNLDKWDGVDRLSTALHDYLGAKQTEYTAFVLRYWMYGAISRALYPGAKFDETLILVGKQGTGKSTFARCLANISDKFDCFTDGFCDFDSNTAFNSLRGIWIAELGEMLAFKRASTAESYKLFLTKLDDRGRQPYARLVESHPRACVFIGTTNDYYFLTDRTGSRRFLPVLVTDKAKKHIQDEPPEIIRQLWAQALHDYKLCGYNAKRYVQLNDEQKKLVLTEAQKYIEDDSREGRIAKYLEETTADRVCILALWREALGNLGDPSRQQLNELHEIMRFKMAGWIPYPKNGGKAVCGQYGAQRCYVREGDVLKEGDDI